MLRKAATTRYVSYSFGTLLTIANLFLITYLLDIYQFGVWGVANSLIYVFSQLAQLTYVQYIEKYFPKYSKERMDYYLFKFIKTVFLTSILWFMTLSLAEYFGYFEKFNAENLPILFLIIALLSCVEASIELSAKYLLALKETAKFDLNELIVFKLFRLVIFYILLINEYSVYYLLLTNLILRSVFLIRVLLGRNEKLINLFKSILFSNVKVDNFKNLSYTFTAFIIKTLQVTFLNVIFLLLTNMSDNETIAIYSLGILIINNLKPIYASLSSLLLPIISKNIHNQKINPELLSLVSSMNKIFIGFTILLAINITKFKLIISPFLESFDSEIYNIILISVAAASITSLYLPKYLSVLFSDNEKKIFQYLLINFISCISIFYYFSLEYETNLIYFYILFELINYLIFSIMFGTGKVKNIFTPSFYILLVYLALHLYGIDFNTIMIFIYLTCLIFDISQFIKYFKAFEKSKNENYET